MKYDGMVPLRWLTSYVGARRDGESNTCSPTQSLIRDTAARLGRIARPPSQPQAAISEAGPANKPSCRKSRRSRRPSVMAREPASIPSRHDAPERRWVDQEHQRHMDECKPDEEPYRYEVPVARQLVAAEERCQPPELHRLVNGESAEGGHRAEQHNERVGRLLERIVLSLGRMVPAQAQIVELHLDGGADVTRSEEE